jgi:hypothetical protein
VIKYTVVAAKKEFTENQFEYIRERLTHGCFSRVEIYGSFKERKRIAQLKKERRIALQEK